MWRSENDKEKTSFKEILEKQLEQKQDIQKVENKLRNKEIMVRDME